MSKKYYAVIINENKNGDHLLTRCSQRDAAEQIAKDRNGKLYEYENDPLEIGEDHTIRGKLIADHSKP